MEHVATSSEAIVAQEGPFAVELCAGNTNAWCACGRISRQPFCDGPSEETSLTPVLFKVEQDGTAYLFGCKTIQGRPPCDGSHDRL